MPYMHKRTFDISNSLPTTVTRKKFNGTEINYDPMPDHFQVDEFIAIPLQILNRKGYLTACSCAGHPFDPLFFAQTDDDVWEPFRADGFCPCISYITFWGDFNFPFLPNGFEQDKAPAGVRIFRNHEKNGDSWETLSSVIDSMKALYDWANELPDLLDSSTK